MKITEKNLKKLILEETRKVIKDYASALGLAQRLNKPQYDNAVNRAKLAGQRAAVQRESKQNNLTKIIKEEIEEVIRTVSEQQQLRQQTIGSSNPEAYSTGGVGNTANPGRFRRATAVSTPAAADTAADQKINYGDYDKIVNDLGEDIALIRQALDSAGISVPRRSNG